MPKKFMHVVLLGGRVNVCLSTCKPSQVIQDSLHMQCVCLLGLARGLFPLVDMFANEARECARELSAFMTAFPAVLTASAKV
jgi:hypothetical protein